MAHEAAGELEQHRAGVALQRAPERQEQHYMRAVALVGAGGGGGGRRGGGAGPRRVAPRRRSLAPSIRLCLLVGLRRVYFCW